MVKQRQRLPWLFCAVLAVAAPCGAALAQQGDGDAARLTLAECLRLALENNYQLVQARIDPEVSAESVTIEEAQYDVGFQIIPSANGFQREKRTPFEVAGKGDTLEVQAGYRQAFTYGGELSASLDLSRETGSNVLFEPFYQSELNLRYTMPLLSGFGKEDAAETLLLARGNLDVSREELRRLVELKMEEVEGAYWNVAAARAALRVARQSLRRAEDLLELNKKKVEVGTLAPIEITQAEAGVAADEESVIVAETRLDDDEDELRRLLAIPPGDPMWNRRVVPIDEPDSAPVELDLEATIATALERRPEIASARADLRNKELSERAARNRVKHGLDLDLLAVPFGNNNEGAILDPGPDGILGTFDDIILGFDEGSASTAVGEIFERENYFWQASVTYSFPIGNRAAKSRHRIASLNRQKADLGLTDLEQTIRVEVRRAVRAVTSGAKRVEAARENVRLQREKLDAEQKKFENGMSTSFEVLTFQNDLADAELAEIRARLDYVRALAGVERARGTLLEARNLALAGPGTE